MPSPRAEIQRALGRAQQGASKMQERVRAFRAEHGHVYGAAALGLLLGLCLAGTGAAVLVGMVSRPTRTITNYSEHVLGTETLTVTRPGKGKLARVEHTVVRRRVVRGPGGVSTLLESVAVPGPSQTRTVAAATMTVMVTGPVQTVTQVVTQIVTEIVTSEVTVTETVPQGP